jgi:hypothetical protein
MADDGMTDDDDMTEDGWLVETDPARMLGHLFPSNTDRRDRLFAIACARRIWHLLDDPRSRHAVETAERYVDGLATPDELEAAADAAASRDDGGGVQIPIELGTEAANAAFYAAVSNCQNGAFQASERATFAVGFKQHYRDPWDDRGRAELAAQADLVRCIIGNPFRAPLALVVDAELVRLATRAYQDRSLPSGNLDPVACAVLADAVEQRGGPALAFEHLRAPTPHVRGCHVIDAILGRT